jgi:8-oxo-dGTP diphosphatase
MKVLLMKYIDKDDSLLSTSQLSVGDSQSQSASQPTTIFSSDAAATATPSTAVISSSSGLEDDEEEEGESENSSLWTSDFSADAAGDSFVPVSQLSQLSQVSQVSQWSELSSTSNLDEIINFLEKQDVQESERVVALEADLKELQATKTNVRVGVGVILTSPQHPQCVLIGARKGSHGEGKFALPGGHLEMFESWKECAIREVKEEVDLDLDEANVAFAYVTNDPMEDEGKHYITIFMEARVPEGQVPRNMEPHKCDGWHWVTWESLRTRENLFVPLLHITRSSFRPALLG